jgi:acyl-CoA synthetase (AMP-forming)/AMP-acid ligase II
VGAGRKVGSVGLPVGVALRIRALEPGRGLAAPGVVGHVEIRGPSVIARYDGGGYDNHVDREGWLRTGDLGYFDEDGYLFLAGRRDDVINRGGEKIFPREIEELALTVDGVRGAAVVGEPDDVYGQVPVLYVELARRGTRDVHRLVAALGEVLTSSLSRSRRPVAITIVSALRLLGSDPAAILWRESVA